MEASSTEKEVTNCTVETENTQTSIWIYTNFITTTIIVQEIGKYSLLSNMTLKHKH